MLARRRVGVTSFVSCCAIIASIDAQVTVRRSASLPRAATEFCSPNPRCSFGDKSGENTYVVTRDTLSRVSGGSEVYSEIIASGVSRVLLAAINEERTQIAVAVSKERVATGALIMGRGFTPETLQRQYTLSLRNPKSGAEIKAIDLGMLKPSSIALSTTGDLAWVAGEEFQFRRFEVRAYNTRSGALAHQESDKNERPTVFDSGYRLGGVYYQLESQEQTWSIRRHSSSNPYSIAEFTVRKGVPLVVSDVANAGIAVVRFEGVSGAVKDLLEGSLVIKLSSVGLAMVERQRIKELLQEAQFQNLGLTDSESAAELGRLVNARFLAFGQLQSTGSVTTIGLRLVDVESGQIRATIDLECRDCTPDDYAQGLGFLVADWVMRNP